MSGLDGLGWPSEIPTPQAIRAAEAICEYFREFDGEFTNDIAAIIDSEITTTLATTNDLTKMNTNEIPTPETDMFFRQDALKNLDKYPAAAFARDLERRLAIEKQRAEEMGKLAHLAACESVELRVQLAIARDALGKIVAQNLTIEQIETIAEKALTQTATK